MSDKTTKDLEIKKQLETVREMHKAICLQAAVVRKLLRGSLPAHARGELVMVQTRLSDAAIGIRAAYSKLGGDGGALAKDVCNTPL